MSRSDRFRYRPAAEPLDGRCLPAAGVSASLVGGVLRIEGTESPDLIEVTYRAQPPGPRSGGLATAIGYVKIDGAWKSPMIRFAGVVVHAHGGDDRIVIRQMGSVGVRISVDAGAGNDVIHGGPAGEVLNGGDGDDVIWGGGGPDTLIGGNGRDTINGVLEPLPVAPTPIAPPTRPPSIPAPTPPPVVTPPPAPGTDLNAYVNDVVAATNVERRKAGLNSLVVSPQLTRMAQIHAEAMARLDRMEHTLPEAAFPTLRDRAEHVGYRFALLGENIAFNIRDPGALLIAWMSSPGHHANLMNSSFTEIGVGVARNSRGELFIAQVLGRPL